MSQTSNRVVLGFGLAVLVLEFFLSQESALATDKVSLFKVITAKDEIVIGLTKDELSQMDGRDAGGVAKMTKLAQGLTDLHSKRGEVDLAELANFAAAAAGDTTLCQRILAANTAAEAFTLAQDAGIALGDAVALAAQHTAEDVIAGRDIAVEIVLFDREQNLVGRAPFKN